MSSTFQKIIDHFYITDLFLFIVLPDDLMEHFHFFGCDQFKSLQSSYVTNLNMIDFKNSN